MSTSLMRGPLTAGTKVAARRQRRTHRLEIARDPAELIAVIVVLAIAVGGFLAYQAYEQNTLDTSVGQDGVKID
jgi:hypothetical protein